MLSRITEQLISAILIGITMVGLVSLMDFRAITRDKPYDVYAEKLAQEPVQSTLLPRFISIDPYGAHLYGLTGAAPPTIKEAEGIRLADTNVGEPAFAIGFTMPPDYAENTEFKIRYIWRSPSVTCGIKLNSFSWVGSVGEVGWSNPNVSLPNSGILLAPNSNTTQDTIAIVSGSSISGRPVRAGDSVTILTSRDGTSTNDTCTGEIQILGISVIYQGLSSYLPLITKQ